jgi:tRNA modification GTPase
MALATPAGESALAIIRTSGGGYFAEGGDTWIESAVDAAAGVFSRPEKLRKAAGSTIVHGWIVHSGEKIDEALVSVYRAPKSYTGEDGVDISCHGGISTVRGVMAALKAAGFREALPGEFTFRAFMNGKLDLTRSESVMEIVSAKTGKSRKQAAHRLAGALEKEISEIKLLLIQVLAGVEIYLDYSEDEVSAPPDEAEGHLPGRAIAEEALARLRRLSGSWKREQLYAEGALAVIAGRPNAGKSSLFNYLLKEDRSIVTDSPGTTRDWIEAVIAVEGIPVRLADTAGLRSSGTADEAERIGIERSLGLLAHADIILYLVDGAQGFLPEDMNFIREARRPADGAKNLLVVWNKADIAPPPDMGHEIPGEIVSVHDETKFRTVTDFADRHEIIAVSAKTGAGITELCSAIAERLEALAGRGGDFSENGETAGPGTLRQKKLIDAALSDLDEALALAGRNETLDIIAPCFRGAVDSLGEITGEVSTADILETMFSRFCVGK